MTAVADKLLPPACLTSVSFLWRLFWATLPAIIWYSIGYAGIQEDPLSPACV